MTERLSFSLFTLGMFRTLPIIINSGALNELKQLSISPTELCLNRAAFQESQDCITLAHCMITPC